jgi:hypothetical protein
VEPSTDLEGLSHTLSQQYDPEMVQELLILVYRYQPADPLRYARRCARTIRAARRREAARPICPVSEAFGLTDPRPSALDMAEMREELLKAPAGLVAEALGLVTLNRNKRFRLRRKGGLN